MDNWRTDWARTKRDVALRLSSKECGGSYAEAVIILCALISAMAAEVWPGRGKDRKRFIEVLVQFAPSNLNTRRISIPLLVKSLREESRTSESNSLEKTYLDYSRTQVLTGDQVDKFEEEIICKCPSLKLKEIRDCSYGSLLYEEIRSAYAHEYHPGSRADSSPLTCIRTAAVSYVNWVDDIDRHIYFHVQWIADVSIAITEVIDASKTTLPRVDPLKWWVDG